MKKIIIITLLIISLVVIKVPKYVELNNLAIIEGIGFEKNSEIYKINLKEIIPIKTDNGIEYKYKYYSYEDKSIKEIKKKIKTSNKKFYLKKVKYLASNIKNNKLIIEELKLNNVTIHYTNEVLKKLKKINS